MAKPASYRTPPSQARLALLRLVAWIWRFGTWNLAEYALRGVPPRTILKRGFYGYVLHVDASRTCEHRLFYFQGVRSVTERHLVTPLATKGARVADVGANIGYYVFLLHRLVGAGGQITSFEPEPDNIEELERNVGANGLDNVRVVRTAVGNKDGTVHFGRGINGFVCEDAPLEVPIVKLDSYFRDKVDLLKIDVEGYEYDVLLGAEGMIRAHRPAIFLEVHTRLTTGHTHRDLWNFLSRYYQELECHEVHPRLSPWEKFKDRYLGAKPIRRIYDTDRLIADCMNDRREHIFWIVCRQVK